MSAIAEGGVAVVTGAASGIGYALSEEALRRGMKVVVSDLREEALAEAAQKLTGQGADVLAVRADVTSEADIVALRDKALSKFGKVNLLVNNAGAFVGGLAWETSAAQMDWIVDLNFKSVAHGIRLFVPSMIEQGDPCHVITIASAAGISVYPGYASYSPTKHAALAITEALYLDLIAEQIGNVGVTIVMPGMVRTDIMNPEKSSPAQLGLDRDARHANATVRGIEATMASALDGAIAPEELARRVFDAADKGELYILPNHEGEALTNLTQAIAMGRASGNNPWPAIMAGMATRMFGEKEETGV
ncbi:MAG: SDR family NAD(P)-dependent oxidoreductase [Novosphingobium sp.]|nr:SDR family NAD(P)-dependent oxidoreductase [Novosphingobium sp.]